MTARSVAAPDLAEEIARAARRPGASRRIFLDLDGTLAPIVREPSLARVPEPTLDAVRTLVGSGWKLAVVSGRPAAAARRLVPVRGVEFYGSHGLEGIEVEPAIEKTLARLRALAPSARALVNGHPGARVEAKPGGIAFHDREVPASGLARWRRAVSEFIDSIDLDGIETLRGRRIVELRPRGIHKGRVVERSLAGLPGSGRDASLAAFGDDTTDEDMFRAIRGRGLAVRVGRPSSKTLATRRLASPAAVGRVLRGIAGIE